MSFPIGLLNGKTNNNALQLTFSNTIAKSFQNASFTHALGVNFLKNAYTRHFDEFQYDKNGEQIYPPIQANAPIDMDNYFRFGFSPDKIHLAYTLIML